MICDASRLASTLIKLGKLDEAKREIIEANKKGGEEHPLVLSVSALWTLFRDKSRKRWAKLNMF